MTEFDRVTQVLSPFSGLDKVPKDILEAACSRGKQVHCAINALINDLYLDEGSEFSGYVTSFKHWAQDKKLFTLERLYDRELFITGEIDALEKLEENTYRLVDFKTSSKENLHPWRLQLSAYAQMVRASGYFVKEIQIIQLSKEGKNPKVFTYEEDFDTFKSCLNLYRLFFKSKKEETDWSYL